jgi:hypothetical protein
LNGLLRCGAVAPEVTWKDTHMIRPDQMIPLFLEACPGLQPSWARYVVQTMNSKGIAAQQTPVLEVVFPYLLGHVKRNYFKEIPAAFAVFETLLNEGDEETRILMETDLLIPLQAAVASSPRSAAVVEQKLGPRARMVWQVIERVNAEQEETEQEGAKQEQNEQHLWAMPGYSFAEARPLYAAFGLIGGGPTGLTYMGWGGGMNLLSLGILLLIWIGLSIAERFQRNQLMMKAQEQEASKNGSEANGTDRFMVRHLWKLLDRAMVLLFVLGFPIGLSIVMGHKNFLDSSLLDILMVVVGAAVLVAIMFRNRLWQRSQVQENEPALHDQHVHDDPRKAVGLTHTRTDAEKSVSPRESCAA